VVVVQLGEWEMRYWTMVHSFSPLVATTSSELSMNGCRQMLRVSGAEVSVAVMDILDTAARTA
jgi:hypothetical protein